LRNHGDVFHAERGAALGRKDCVFDIVHIPDQPYFPDVDLLQAGFQEAAPRVDVVIGELLLHLRETQPVRNQLIRIDAHLIFPRGPAERVHIDDIRDGFQVLLDGPIFEGLQVHYVVLRIGVVQREEVDLPHRAPVGSHLG
jgi:hypothetical protein